MAVLGLALGEFGFEKEGIGGGDAFSTREPAKNFGSATRLATDPERVAGKLVFQDSPFTGWVRAHVEEPSRNALCVESADGLTGPGYRVTLAGQTRNGRSGAHGRGDTRNIIGFSNADAIAEVDAELAELEQRLDAQGAEVAALDRASRVLEQQRTSYDLVATARLRLSRLIPHSTACRAL